MASGVLDTEVEEEEEEEEGAAAAAEEEEDGAAAVAAAVSLETTRVNARFSDFSRSFSAFKRCSCCDFPKSEEKKEYSF